MNKCESCAHYDACKNLYDILMDGRELPDQEECERFKDRSRFVELPCKVGDTVYVWSSTLPTHKLDIDDDEIPQYFPAIIVSIRKNTNGVWIKFRIRSRWLHPQYDNECGLYEEGVDMWKYFTFPASAIGKTVFLTREEAEAELARRTANG